MDRRLVLAGGAEAVAVAGGLWLRRGAVPAAARIAELPFANLSGDAAQAYFSDGMAEEVRNALGRLPGLFADPDGDGLFLDPDGGPLQTINVTNGLMIFFHNK